MGPLLHTQIQISPSSLNKAPPGLYSWPSLLVKPFSLLNESFLKLLSCGSYVTVTFLFQEISDETLVVNDLLSVLEYVKSAQVNYFDEVLPCLVEQVKHWIV